MPRENGFKNQRVVIVGGSSGIGLAVAEEAASLGAEVVIVTIGVVSFARTRLPAVTARLPVLPASGARIVV